MTAFSPDTRARLAKLLLLLSSDRDGEVVAAAAAIGRALQSAGANWHDLASVVTNPPTVEALPPPATDPAGMLDDLLSLPLRPSERKFVQSLNGWYSRLGSLSPKQYRALRRIYEEWLDAA